MIDFEQALMQKLSDAKLDESTLRTYSSALVGLRKNEIMIDRVCRYGIPDPDGICVNSRIGIKDIDRLKEILLVPNIHNIEIFPIGIIAPEFFDVRFRMGGELHR